MSYTFRSVSAAPHLKSYVVTVDTPKEHRVTVCTAEDSAKLRAAFLAVFQAGKESARREMRDALGMPAP